jgi:hypothetical protein
MVSRLAGNQTGLADPAGMFCEVQTPLGSSVWFLRSSAKRIVSLDTTESKEIIISSMHDSLVV